MGRNTFKRSISLVLALMMVLPMLIGNTAFGIPGGSTLTPGTVALTKVADWVPEGNRIAEVKFTVKGEPVKTAVDVVLVVDRSGSMGFGGGNRYSPCTNPDHWNGNVHKNDKTNWPNSNYDKDHGCTDRMDDAKNAANVFLDNLLYNNVPDEFGNKNRVALVSFNNNVSSNINDFTDAKSTIQGKINNLTPDDGTNYEKALEKARDYIKNRNKSEGLKQETVNSRPTFIVMLSDGRPDPDDKHGKSIADNLKTFTGEKLTIFTLGLNISDSDANVLKYIATNGGTNGYYKNVTDTSNDLKPFLEEIASLMKPAGTNAILHDVISEHFDYYEDGTYKPNKEIVQSGKNVTWNIGTISKNETILTFYVQLKEEYNKSGTYPTNDSASLTYTTVGNESGSKDAESPHLSVTKGSITVRYLLVDEATGKYIAENNKLTDDIAYAQSVGGGVTFDLELTTHTVVPSAPSGYILYSDAVTQNITLTEEVNGKDKTVNFNVYAIPKETYGYTINYYINGTETKVPGISPNPVTGVGTEGHIVAVHYPTVSGYKVMEGQPRSLTVTAEGTVVTVYYEEVAENQIAYTVKHLVQESNQELKVTNDLGNAGDVITAYAEEFEGYDFAPEQSDEQQMTLEVDGYNTIVFWYIKDTEPEPEPEPEIEIEDNVIIVKHYTKTGSNNRVLAKTDEPIKVTTSSTIYGSVYEDKNIVKQGFTFAGSDPESIKVYARTTTESAIKQFIFELLYTKSGGGGGNNGGGDNGGGGDTGGGGGNPPVVIPDNQVPLAELEKTDHFAYIIGYPEGDVRPLNNITREEVAMIFYRLLTDESRNALLSDTNPFTDMDAGRWSNRAISTLFNADIISGYPDGTFRPSAPITRAEFATIAAKFDDLNLDNPTQFTDILGHWAEQYITSSENKGWIKGYPDMTFKPQQDITRAEAMTLINNVLGRKVPAENIHADAMFWPDNASTEWYYEAVMEATNSHDYVIEEDGDELWTGMKANKVWP